jgi:hypothetical protein
MSMEIFVVSDSRLNTMEEWQRAIDAEGFPLRLPLEKPLAQVGGGDPTAQLHGKSTRIEYNVLDLKSLTDGLHDRVDFRHDWKHVLGFIFGGSFAEGAAAWMAATAYARATRGLVFDTQEVKLFSPDEALKIANDLDRSRPEMEVMIEKIKQQILSDKPKQ